MKREDIFEKMYAFRAQKPWHKISPEQLITFPADGRTCYVHLSSQDGNESVVTVYFDDQGLKYCRQMNAAMLARDASEMLAAAHRQDCISAMLNPKDALRDEQVEEVRAFAKAHDIHLAGKNAWPCFFHMHPWQPPTNLEDGAADTEILGRALDRLLWAAAHMEDLPFPPALSGGDSVLLLREGIGGYTPELAPLPDVQPDDYPIGKSGNDLYKARVKKLKKKGVLGCDLTISSTPSPAEGVTGYYFAWILETCTLPDGNAVYVRPVRDYENRTDVMLDKLMEAVIERKVCPETIEVYHPRTEALLRDWCAEMKIALVLKEEKPECIARLEWMEMMGMDEETAEDFMTMLGLDGDDDEYFDDDPYFWDDDDEEEDWAEEDDVRKMLSMTLLMMESSPDEVLLSNRKELRSAQAELKFMKEALNLPKEDLDRLNRQIRRIDSLLRPGGKKKGRKSRTPERSYVISVSLGTGCYRHIRISNHATLAELSDFILSAFGFVDDHAHAFFMDNRAYSPCDCYYVDGIDPDFPTTDSVDLEQAGLRTGLKFKYVFDFGEDWTFQCRVLKETDEVSDMPEIVRAKGAAPEQYPDWDDDEDDWDEDEEDWDEDEDDEDD